MDSFSTITKFTIFSPHLPEFKPLSCFSSHRKLFLSSIMRRSQILTVWSIDAVHSTCLSRGLNSTCVTLLLCNFLFKICNTITFIMSGHYDFISTLKTCVFALPFILQFKTGKTKRVLGLVFAIPVHWPHSSNRKWTDYYFSWCLHFGVIPTFLPLRSIISVFPTLSPVTTTFCSPQTSRLQYQKLQIRRVVAQITIPIIHRHQKSSRHSVSVQIKWRTKGSNDYGFARFQVITRINF